MKLRMLEDFVERADVNVRENLDHVLAFAKKPATAAVSK